MAKLTQSDVLALMKKVQGERSLRQFAKEIGVSAPYLADVYHGRRTPGPTILKHLGLHKVVTTETTYTRKSIHK